MRARRGPCNPSSGSGAGLFLLLVVDAVVLGAVVVFDVVEFDGVAEPGGVTLGDLN